MNLKDRETGGRHKHSCKHIRTRSHIAHPNDYIQKLFNKIPNKKKKNGEMRIKRKEIRKRKRKKNAHAFRRDEFGRKRRDRRF